MRSPGGCAGGAPHRFAARTRARRRSRGGAAAAPTRRARPEPSRPGRGGGGRSRTGCGPTGRDRTRLPPRPPLTSRRGGRPAPAPGKATIGTQTDRRRGQGAAHRSVTAALVGLRPASARSGEGGFRPPVAGVGRRRAPRDEGRPRGWQPPAAGWDGAGRCRSASRSARQAAPGRRSRRRSNWALRATTMVETLISSAPAAGARVNPIGASTPAASGIASTL